MEAAGEGTHILRMSGGALINMFLEATGMTVEDLDAQIAAGEGLVETSSSSSSSSSSSATSSQEFLDGIESATSSQEFLDHLETLFPTPTEPRPVWERGEDDTESGTRGPFWHHWRHNGPPFNEWPLPDNMRRLLPLDMIDTCGVAFVALRLPDRIQTRIILARPTAQSIEAGTGEGDVKVSLVVQVNRWCQEQGRDPLDPKLYVTSCLPHREVLHNGPEFDPGMSETDWLLTIYRNVCAELEQSREGSWGPASSNPSPFESEFQGADAAYWTDREVALAAHAQQERVAELARRAGQAQAQQERQDREVAEAFRLAGVRDQEQRAAEAAATAAAVAAVTKIQALQRSRAARRQLERQAAAAAAAKEEQREASRAGQRGITRTDSAQARFEENSGADANAKRIADSAARKQAEKEDKKRKREEQLASKNKKQKQKTRPPAAGGGGD